MTTCRWEMRLWTMGPIESAFATVRVHRRVLHGPGSRSAGIQRALKTAGARPSPVAQVQWTPSAPACGARFQDDEVAERPTHQEVARKPHDTTGLNPCLR